ncbi:MAG: 50S ribosomal protein L18e [Candidatus Micrarchaeaceae archaeon]
MKINAEKENVKEWLEALGRAQEGHKGIWESARRSLSVPARSRASINIYKLNKYTKQGDAVIVPGKVLSMGSMDHSITIAALEYSAQALGKLKASNCTIMGIGEIIKQGNVRLMK